MYAALFRLPRTLLGFDLPRQNVWDSLVNANTSDLRGVLARIDCREFRRSFTPATGYSHLWGLPLAASVPRRGGGTRTAPSRVPVTPAGAGISEKALDKAAMTVGRLVGRRRWWGLGLAGAGRGSGQGGSPPRDHQAPAGQTPAAAGIPGPALDGHAGKCRLLGSYRSQ